jgi:predicted  nucleic acid-binding Zn-ribbon protein
MSAALGLLRLQQVDSRLSQVEARIQAIKEILESDAELAAAQQTLARAQTEQQESDLNRRRIEAQAQVQQIKIQQAESSLYGGTVRNPKELQDLEADVVSLKKHLTQIEDEELESMAALESAQISLQETSAQVAQLRARLEVQHGALLMEDAVLDRDRQDLLAERQAAVSAVAAEFLNRYEDLRRLRRGLAVAEVSENACAACGTVLTAALQQNARHATQLTYCPSCGRILYAG